MTTTRRILLSVAAVAACSLGATAATAAADTYCVSDAACLAAGGINSGGLQPALDQAKGHTGPDVVKIGAGTFSGGPYAYTDGNGANPVQIQGAGAGATTLTMPAVKSL